jgi:hypothetical protein
MPPVLRSSYSISGRRPMGRSTTEAPHSAQATLYALSHSPHGNSSKISNRWLRCGEEIDECDAHVHLVWNASAEPHELVAREGHALTALRCAHNVALHLRAGVTTVRDTGATDPASA